MVGCVRCAKSYVRTYLRYYPTITKDQNFKIETSSTMKYPALTTILALLHTTHPFQPIIPSRTSSSCHVNNNRPSSSTSLSNILRDYASYSSSPWDDPSQPSLSSDWRRSSGYSTSPPPLPLGGSVSPRGVRKEMETNPYYDAGWAQSVRRDDPNNFGRWGEGGSNYNGYNDPCE